MGLFGKKRADFVDLADMRKRGILRESARVDEQGIVDLGSSGSSGSASTISGGFDFLGNLAGAGNSSESGGGSYTNKLKALRFGPNAELKNLKVKMEDIEYKLDRFLERLEKIEDKLG